MLSARTALLRLRQLVRPETYYTGAKLQERIDVLRLYLVTSARATWPDIHVKTEEQLEAVAPRLAHQRTAVQKNVLGQAVKLLTSWLHEQPPPLPLLAKLPAEAKPDVVVAAERLRDKMVAQHEEAITDAQKRAFGFSLGVRASGTPGGEGFGVFIGGKAIIGSVLAFYPGVAMTPADLLRVPIGTLQLRFKGNDNMIQRFDGTLIDASEAALKLLPPLAAGNPLAVAHRVNHPPVGSKPNVFCCPIDFTVPVPAELQPVLPNVRYAAAEALLIGSSGRRGSRTFADIMRSSLADMASAESSGSGVPLRGLALVALRELNDEELFLDFRLNPRKKCPAWYSPVNEEENLRRWNLIK